VGKVIHLSRVKEKKMNRYFHSIPVCDYRQARALGSRTNWEIIEALRDAGSAGLTAKEMMKELSLSKNTVYGALRFLEGPSEDSAWIVSRRPPKHPGKKHQEEKFRTVKGEKELPQRIELVGTATRIYVEEVPFGRGYVDADFAEVINPIVKKAVLELKEKWAEIIDSVIEQCKKDKKKEYFPDHDDKPCEECGVKHEAYEFVEAVSTILHQELMDSLPKELFSKHGFGCPKQDMYCA